MLSVMPLAASNDRGDVTPASVGSLASSSSPEQAPATSTTSAANAIATEPAQPPSWAIVACDLRC